MRRTPFALRLSGPADRSKTSFREALDRYLTTDVTEPSRPDALLASGRARKPRLPLSRPVRRIALPPGETSSDALDRDDRF